MWFTYAKYLASKFSFFVEDIAFKKVSRLLSWVRKWLVEQKDLALLQLQTVFYGFIGILYSSWLILLYA